MPWTDKQMLRDANGDLIPQYWDITAEEFKPLTGQGGANDVRLTGSNVEKVVVLDSIAITDDGIHNLLIERSVMQKYSRIYFIVRNSLSVQVKLRFFPSLIRSVMVYDGEGFSGNDEVVIGAANSIYVLHGVFNWLDNLVLDDNLHIRYQAVNTPTSGSFSLFMMGVRK